MAGQARLGDKASAQADAHGCPGCPHPTNGPAIAGSPNVNVNGRPALRQDDTGIHAACCGPNTWTAVKGAPTVFINGKAAIRKDDATQHCGGSGRMIEGSANVIVGDAGGAGGSAAGNGGSPTGNANRANPDPTRTPNPNPNPTPNPSPNPNPNPNPTPNPNPNPNPTPPTTTTTTTNPTPTTPTTPTPPKAVHLARLSGMFFDTNKCFLLPSAMHGATAVIGLYRQHPSAKVLVVGHTDRAGGERENMALSLERADAVAAFLTDDVDAWIAWFGAHRPAPKRWGTREVQLMLSALPYDASPFYRATPTGNEDAATHDAVRAFQRWSNEQHGTSLTLDGRAGAETRRALVKAYMALDGTSLPVGIEARSHGCGEYFPAVATADGERNAENRRVEVFFFEDGDISPPPPGDKSPPGSTAYPAWRDAVQRKIDVRHATLTVVVVDEGDAPVANVRVLLAGPTPGDALTDEQGRAYFVNLDDGDYLVVCETDDPERPRATITIPLTKTVRAMRPDPSKHRQRESLFGTGTGNDDDDDDEPLLWFKLPTQPVRVLLEIRDDRLGEVFDVAEMEEIIIRRDFDGAMIPWQPVGRSVAVELELFETYTVGVKPRFPHIAVEHTDSHRRFKATGDWLVIERRHQIWFVTIDSSDHADGGKWDETLTTGSLNTQLSNQRGQDRAIHEFNRKHQHQLSDTKQVWTGGAIRKLTADVIERSPVFAIFGAGSWDEWSMWIHEQRKPWRADSEHWARIVKSMHVPMLAYCGSHQLIHGTWASWDAVGHMHQTKVVSIGDEHRAGSPNRVGRLDEVGSYPITAVKPDPLFNGLPAIMYFSEHHADQVLEGKYSTDFELIAKGMTGKSTTAPPSYPTEEKGVVTTKDPSTRCEVQALRLRSTDRVLYTVQFHPEIDYWWETDVKSWDEAQKRMVPRPHAGPILELHGKRLIINFLEIALKFWKREPYR